MLIVLDRALDCASGQPRDCFAEEADRGGRRKQSGPGERAA